MDYYKTHIFGKWRVKLFCENVCFFFLIPSFATDFTLEYYANTTELFRIWKWLAPLEQDFPSAFTSRVTSVHISKWWTSFRGRFRRIVLNLQG